MSVHKKLMQARLTLQGTKLKKSGHNKFAGYQYFELGDFIPTVQSIFYDLGLCGIVSYGQDIASLTITDTEDGTSLVITSPMSSAALKGCHEVQNLGAVETYVRRYLWVTAMEIVEHDALDASAGAATKKQTAIPATFKNSPTMGIFESLPKDRQEVILNAAHSIVHLYDMKEDLIGAWEEADAFQDDERVALQSKLPSHVKTALRKHGEWLKTHPVETA